MQQQQKIYSSLPSFPLDITMDDEFSWNTRGWI